MKLIDVLPEVRGIYRENFVLGKSTWFGVGGACDIFFKPEDIDDLKHFLKHKPQSIPITVLGLASNLLIRDGGIEGVVIKLGRNFANISIENSQLHVGAGALDYNVALFCREEGLAGLEFLIGIPGTIGGAIAMNAGAYGRDISMMLEKAEAVDVNGIEHTLSNKDIGFIYRGNSVPKNWIFTKAIFKIIKGDKQEIASDMDNISKNRAETQPIRNKTSGSTFVNPLPLKAWELIDQAGCRNLRVGGAVVSDKHCNFIINDNNATALDIENLGNEVKQRVKNITNIDLEWEVKVIGRYEK
ncbi:UDP-N-acetylenolpyruvoylglucosamine reductase [Rickettsiales bacterium Ac37b]|nr:UDP-N-acetylenolpyruvoylglucosamine reductase [Rickettsiales bacterium Ac37b]